MLGHVVVVDDEFFESVEDLSDSFQEIDTAIDMEVLLEKLNRVIATKLSRREREVVSYLYGLGGYQKLRPFEIASKLQVSRGTVSYYIKRAFTKLNAAFNEDTVYYDEII